MKYLFATILAVVILTGAGCVSPATDQFTTNQAADTNMEAVLSGQSYTDAKTGISFRQLDGWTVSTDESDNLYMYSQEPYQTVTFEVFTDQSTWEEKQYNPVNPSDSMVPDVLVDSGQKMIGGQQTLFEVYERQINGKPLFRYARYFVDAGSVWYLIHTSDPTAAVEQIIDSVQFGLF